MTLTSKEEGDPDRLHRLDLRHRAHHRLFLPRAGHRFAPRWGGGRAWAPASAPASQRDGSSMIRWTRFPWKRRAEDHSRRRPRFRLPITAGTIIHSRQRTAMGM